MIHATLFAPRSAAAQPVTLGWEQDEMAVKDGNASVRCFQRAELAVSPRLGRLPREIVLPTGEKLVADQNTSLNYWLDGDKGGRIAMMETRRRWIIASVLMVPLLLYVAFGRMMPWAAVQFAALVPDSVKVIASQQTLAALDFSMLEPSTLSAEAQNRIRNGFYHLNDKITLKHSYPNIQFRNAPMIGPNAFALPDGTIIFTDALVELVESDQALLNAIFLHEIGHVALNHSMQLVAESLFATLAVSYFFGDISGSLEAFFGIGSTVVQNKFSQAHEADADAFALHQLSLAGEDPMHFAEAMKKLSELRPEGNGELEDWFSSHPKINARIERARAFAESVHTGNN